MARALIRSLPSGNPLTTSARTAGEASEPPTPWMARAASRMPAEQQQAAERQRVPVHHPGQARGGEVQPGLDVRQCDVHDGRVENDHELGAEHNSERDARAGTRALGAGVTDIRYPIR